MAFTMYNYRKENREKSSPRIFAEPDEVALYSSGRQEDDIILGHGVGIAFYEHDRGWKHGVNGNVICVGGTGSGKSHNFVMPNIANLHRCSYVATDPKGELLRLMGQGIKESGYEVQVLDTIKLAESTGYDPLRYIRREEDILTVVNLILDAISPKRHVRGGENSEFWQHTSEMLFCAVIGILWELEHIDGCFSPDGDPSAERKYLRMNRALDMLPLISITETNYGEGKNPLDFLVEGVENGHIEAELFDPRPSAYGPRQYRSFRTAAGRTLKSIVISLQASVSKLNTLEMRRIFEHDEVRLDAIDEGLRFIDIKMSDSDGSKAFLANILLKQLILEAERKADAMPNGRLAQPLMFVLDEFPNIGKITDFERTIATVRSRGINFLLCAQSISQLRGVYGEDAATTILDCCDTFVYMGSGSSVETARFVSDLCGESELGTNYVGAERTATKVRGEVVTPGEVRLLPRTDCLVTISECRPFRTKKFGVHEHPNFKRFAGAEWSVRE